jgi:monoamine oxidase
MGSIGDQDAVDVTIVGAGLAGLVAAYRLHQRGQRVLVLEAKSRPGGRLLTLAIPGGVVDCGATWIGPQQTAVLGLLDELKLDTWQHHYEGRHLLIWNGRPRAFRGDVPRLPLLGLADAAIATWRLDRMARSLIGIEPWQHPRAAEYDAMSLGDWVDRHTRTAGARFFFQLVTGPSFGCKPHELSLLGFLAHVAAGGNLRTLVGGKDAALDRHIVGGAARMCEVLAARLGDRVRYNAAVTAIDQTSDVATLSTAGGPVRTRRVVLAVDPVTARAIRHAAPLSEQRIALEREFRLGSGIKAHFIYERPFWRDAGLSGQSFANTGFVALTFDVTPPNGAGVLMTFFGAAFHDPAVLTPGAANQRRELAIVDLVARFGPEAAHPIDYLEQDWSTERYQSGCVPVAAPGVLTRARDAFTRPIGRVHFAGAETSQVWEGHMDGAVRSGDRVAKEILASA